MTLKQITTAFFIIILLLSIAGCSSFPSTKTVIIDPKASFDKPEIQLYHHNLDKLKSIRDSLDDGSFLVQSIFADTGIDCIVNEPIDASLPQLVISVFEETKHVEFKTKYHGYIAFLVQYQGESIYYRNYSYISSQSIHSQRILVPMLEKQFKAISKDIYKNFYIEKKQEKPIEDGTAQNHIKENGGTKRIASNNALAFAYHL